MTRPRDSMNARVHSACEEIYPLGKKFANNADAEKWLKWFTKLKRYRKFFEPDSPAIAKHKSNARMLDHVPNMIVTGPHSACTSWAVDWSPPDAIAVTDGYRNAMYFTHVLAHIVQPDDTAFHGPQFVQIWLDLIARAHSVAGQPNAGREVRREVKDILIKHRVKTRAVSQETRLRQRDALYRRQVPTAREKLLETLRGLHNDDTG